MAEPTDSRVAVYIDFDNIVISQYDRVHGRGSYMKSRTAVTAERLEQASVNLGAILDFASSFGSVAISRAYADWSNPANSRYKSQLVDRAVDLVQLFPTAGTKNGADIRLSVDVVEELFRLPDITHVVIVAGDSDYIPLAQNVRRLGRTVIAIGVAGSTSQAFKNAVDEFSYYADLPGVEPSAVPVPAVEEEVIPDAGAILVRALRVARGNGNDDEWMEASAVKSQMRRLESSFDEKKLGFKSFTDFIKSQKGVVEMKEDGQSRRVRLVERS